MTTNELIQWVAFAKFTNQTTNQDRIMCLDKTKPDNCAPLDYHIACVMVFYAWHDIRDWAMEAGIDVDLFGLEKTDKIIMSPNL